MTSGNSNFYFSP